MTKNDDRERRLAEALRANLRKRKAQGRGEDGVEQNPLPSLSSQA